MTKFLIFLLVIWIIARLAKRWVLKKAVQMQKDLQAQVAAQMGAQMNSQMGARMGGNMGGADAFAGHGPAQSQAETMVACAHCGLHIPQSEAVQRAGQSYCSQEHAGQGA